MEIETHDYKDIRERNAAMDLALHDRIIGTEFFNFTCGDLLGYGISRYVFEYKRDKRWVVKIDLSCYSANSLEWQIWSDVEKIPQLSKWFAPCGDMTRACSVMLQRRCKIKLPHDKYPNKVPDFFSDLKYDNWGMFNGKMVCLDYASTSLVQLRKDYKLVPAKWH